jgi:hypothetical protein
MAAQDGSACLLKRATIMVQVTMALPELVLPFQEQEWVGGCVGDGADTSDVPPVFSQGDASCDQNVRSNCASHRVLQHAYHPSAGMPFPTLLAAVHVL